MSPQEKNNLAVLWLAALAVIGGAFAVPKSLQPLLVVVALILAVWGSIALPGWLRIPMIIGLLAVAGYILLFSKPTGFRQTIFAIREWLQLETTPSPSSTPSHAATPTPTSTTAAATRSPSPRPSPSPSPTAAEVRKAIPLPTPVPTPGPEEYYYPEATATPEYYDSYAGDEPDNTAEEAAYIANFVNKTSSTLSLEHLYNAQWLPFHIAPGETTLIGSTSLRMVVRPCECYYRDWDPAAPEWSVDASEAGKLAPTKSFEFFTDRRGKIDLRRHRR